MGDLTCFTDCELAELVPGTQFDQPVTVRSFPTDQEKRNHQNNSVPTRVTPVDRLEYDRARAQ